MCALSATALTLAVVELDGLLPPASVSVIGTGIGAALLCVAAVADRRWWHLGGLLIGITAATSALVTGAWIAKRHRATASLWPLLPAGAVMGWVGPLGAVVGVAGFAVVFTSQAMFVPKRASGEKSTRGSGAAVAAPVGVGAAHIGAFVAGNSIGR
jgi:hypothetical protein